MTDKCMCLFKAARLILEDGCPPDPKQYICRVSECFDETACTRCWDEYLLRIVNAREDEL